MKFFLSLTFIFLLIIIVPVKAQDTTEGRITEHNVISIVALAGLLGLVYLSRKYRNPLNVENNNI